MKDLNYLSVIVFVMFVNWFDSCDRPRIVPQCEVFRFRGNGSDGLFVGSVLLKYPNHCNSIAN